MENLNELSYSKIIEISGGSDASYNAGYVFGQSLKKTLEWAGMLSLFGII